jgi:hypothetical protein
MYYQICISGTGIPLEETKDLKTRNEINSWLQLNQVVKPSEGEEGFDTWEYSDLAKYILLPFTDEGVFDSTLPVLE